MSYIHEPCNSTGFITKSRIVNGIEYTATAPCGCRPGQAIGSGVPEEKPAAAAVKPETARQRVRTGFPLRVGLD